MKHSQPPVRRNRKTAGKKRARRRSQGILAPLVVIAFCLICLTPMVTLSLRQSGQREDAVPADLNVVTLPNATLPSTPEPTPVPTAVPTAEPTPTPTPAPTATPEPFEYLPVVTSGGLEGKRIAITVDDCYQTDNLRAIVKLAEKNNAKLTLFPVGENLKKPGMAEILQDCVFRLGFEVENHTYTHARIFRLPEEEMAAEIWNQSRAVDAALGVNYGEHFLRLMGGDGSNDQRTHNYLSQLGYLGIAGWSLSGSDAGLERIKNNLSPGMIYLFHTTDPDMEKLRQFIPWARSQGYQLVTLNELLGLPENTVSPYTEREMPAPRAYTVDYSTHKFGDYAWIIVQMQNVLREQGYLEMDGPSTGYYGEQTQQAVSSFQKGNGLTATGEADSQTQKLILGIAA